LYQESSSAISKTPGTASDTASVVSETGSSVAPQRKKKKNRNRHQSDDSDNVKAMMSSSADDFTGAEAELKQTQQWLLTQMKTGVASAVSSRFVFVIGWHFTSSFVSSAIFRIRIRMLCYVAA